MSSALPQYEFSPEQNTLFSSLAHKMGWSGLFFVVFGGATLLVALLPVVGTYRHELPPEWVSQLPPETQAQTQNLPPNHQLWGYALNAGLAGLLNLLIGLWTRSAAAS